MDQIFLADVAGVFDDADAFTQTQIGRHAAFYRRLGQEDHGRGGGGNAERAEHGAVMHGLRGGDGGVGVAHRGGGDETAF